jgi:lipoprotein Spr
MLTVPFRLLSLRYNGTCYPGAPGAVDLAGGANCQLFAYELLRHFGRTLPPLRSSELWADARYTQQVTDLEPLDLLLWNSTYKSWGAHVGVYLGEGQAIHLSRAVGVPAVWPLSKFPKQPRYRVFIRAKRTAQLPTRAPYVSRTEETIAPL